MIKVNLINKIFFLLKIILIFLVISIKSSADTVSNNQKMVFIGPNNADVKVKIFSSFTCPHCANFHINVVPELKKKYVESGKVQLIFIDFPLDLAAFNASKLLHCVDKKKQINYLDIIYQKQSEWTSGTNINDINSNLKKIVKNLGISSSQFDRCLIDEAISDKILK